MQPVARGRAAVDYTRHRPPAARRWYALLAVPVTVPLIVPLYNRTDPYLLGVPFFYWCQLGFVFLDIIVITTVYLATKRRY
jgi:Protein of unknown function (DUF3311)